jgi:hypothetical protein
MSEQLLKLQNVKRKTPEWDAFWGVVLLRLFDDLKSVFLLFGRQLLKTCVSCFR